MLTSKIEVGSTTIPDNRKDEDRILTLVAMSMENNLERPLGPHHSHGRGLLQDALHFVCFCHVVMDPLLSGIQYTLAQT